MGRVLQTRPRSKALPPPRWLDCATDPGASVQALEKRRLETAARDDALPRARACQLNRVNSFVGIPARLNLREFERRTEASAQARLLRPDTDESFEPRRNARRRRVRREGC